MRITNNVIQVKKPKIRNCSLRSLFRSCLIFWVVIGILSVDWAGASEYFWLCEFIRHLVNWVFYCSREKFQPWSRCCLLCKVNVSMRWRSLQCLSLTCCGLSEVLRLSRGSAPGPPLSVTVASVSPHAEVSVILISSVATSASSSSIISITACKLTKVIWRYSYSFLNISTFSNNKFVNKLNRNIFMNRIRIRDLFTNVREEN